MYFLKIIGYLITFFIATQDSISPHN